MGLSFKELRETNLRRCARWHAVGEPWSGADWSNATAGEGGELGHVVEGLFLAGAVQVRLGVIANTVKKLRRHETGTGSQNNPEVEELMKNLRKEGADVQIYLDLLMAHYDIDLGEATIEKFNEVSEREGMPERLGTYDAPLINYEIPVFPINAKNMDFRPDPEPVRPRPNPGTPRRTEGPRQYGPSSFVLFVIAMILGLIIVGILMVAQAKQAGAQAGDSCPITTTTYDGGIVDICDDFGPDYPPVPSEPTWQSGPHACPDVPPDLAQFCPSTTTVATSPDTTQLPTTSTIVTPVVVAEPTFTG